MLTRACTRRDCACCIGQDLRRNGARLGEILRAGDWKSPAFLQYLDAEQLEMERVAEGQLDDELCSDDDES